MSIVRRLPSVDWIAIALQSWWGWAWAVAIAAIVMPSVLREIGLLKDGDEFLLGVAHRAAFHAMMCAVILIMVTRILRAVSGTEGLSPGGSMGLVEGAFLVSYLLQYWGAREGTSRIFLGAAALAAVNLLVCLRPQYEEVRFTALGTISALVITLIGLSFLVRARPRLSAWVLRRDTLRPTLGIRLWRHPVHPPLRLYGIRPVAGAEIDMTWPGLPATGRT